MGSEDSSVVGIRDRMSGVESWRRVVDEYFVRTRDAKRVLTRRMAAERISSAWILGCGMDFESGGLFFFLFLLHRLRW